MSLTTLEMREEWALAWYIYSAALLVAKLKRSWEVGSLPHSFFLEKLSLSQSYNDKKQIYVIYKYH